MKMLDLILKKHIRVIKVAFFQKNNCIWLALLLYIFFCWYDHIIIMFD